MAKINQEEYEILKGLDKEWKWIARDSEGGYSGRLFAYLEKPSKLYDVDEWDYGRGIHYIDNHLAFQFIQWEDGEPWNIQELIEGYEDESEETEVKKDIEWAIKEIEGLETEPSQNYPHDEMIEIEIVLGILSQLVPKQEEVDQAYKAGYETGKEHATRDDEPETVASVMADFFGAAARLIEVLAMEVEEMENDDN